MAENVKLVLAQPDKTVKVGEFRGVIIPAFLGNFTVISGQMPSLFALTLGMVQLLDAKNEVSEKYFIRGGTAEVANDVCTISASEVINSKEITLSEVGEILVEKESDFYSMIENELKAFSSK